MGAIAGVSVDDLEPVQGTRLLLTVDVGGSKVVDWARENAADVERLVQQNGALLIRGLKFLGSQQFGAALSALFDEDLLEYTYRSTPRTELRARVYTATEYPQDQVIPLHNENSYSNAWAMRIGFLCTLPASDGGSTPICDSRRVYEEIPDDVRRTFEERGVEYVRNYSEIDIPWTDVFQTTEKSEVERFCRANRLSFEWVSGDHLRTRQVNQASAIHPITGVKVWFNQAHLFHLSSLQKEVQESLLSLLGESQLPRNTYYGDGSPISEEALRSIREVYERNKIAFTWQRNDLLLLDNMLYAHGRDRYSGNRQVLVGMARQHAAPAAAVVA